MGIGKRAPYFHEASAATLNAAVRFYDSAAFNNSPASAQVGGIGDALDGGTRTADLVAFLSVVGEEPEPPEISGVVANQMQTTAASLRPFSNVTVSDPTVPAQTLIVTVALDDAAKGLFSTLGGFALIAPGTWTFSGAAAAATPALRALVFDHAPNRTPLGLTERTRFTLGVNDGVATTLFNDNTTVISTTIATLSVTPVPALRTLNTGASIPIAFSIAGLNTAASDFRLSVTSSSASIIANSAIAIGGTGPARTLTLTPQTGATGVTTIIATQGGQTITQTFQVTEGFETPDLRDARALLGSLDAPPPPSKPKARRAGR